MSIKISMKENGVLVDKNWFTWQLSWIYNENRLYRSNLGDTENASSTKYGLT